MSNIDIRYLEQAKHLLEMGYMPNMDLHELAAKLQATQGKRIKDNEPDEIEEAGDGVQVTVVDSRKGFIRR